MNKLKYIFLTCFIMCTACYPTGEYPLHNENSMSLKELNVSSLSNVNYNFYCFGNYNSSYPIISAEWKELNDISKTIKEIFIDNEKNICTRKEEGLSSLYDFNENNYNIYHFNNNGFLLYDTGYINYIKNIEKSEKSGYFEVANLNNVLCAPYIMERFFSDNLLKEVDIKPFIEKTDNILKSINITSVCSPETYAINRHNLMSLPYGQSEDYDDFEIDNEGFLIQYRQMFNGLQLSYFQSHSNVKDAEGITPSATFIFSRKGLEYFDVEIVEKIEESEHIPICSFNEAALAIKTHIESLYSENNEKVTVTGGELNYISEIDSDSNIIKLIPAWIFIKELVFDDDTPYFEPLIINASNAQLYN